MPDDDSTFQCPRNLSPHVFMLFTTYTKYEQLGSDKAAGVLDCLAWAAANAAILRADIFTDRGLFEAPRHGPAERSFINHFTILHEDRARAEPKAGHMVRLAGLHLKHGHKPSMAVTDMIEATDNFLQACGLGVKDLALAPEPSLPPKKSPAGGLSAPEAS